MAAFVELDWTRFDVWAVVAMGGVAVVKSEHREACLAWLRQHDYAVTSVDFGLGVSLAVGTLGEKFRWEEQFGYRLMPESRNLDALRDGFDFNLKPGEGHVLELLNAEVAHREDPRWLLVCSPLRTNIRCGNWRSALVSSRRSCSTEVAL